MAFQEWVDEHATAELAALEEASDLSVQALGAYLDAVVDNASPDEAQRPSGPGLLGRMFRAVDLGPTVVKPVDEANIAAGNDLTNPWTQQFAADDPACAGFPGRSPNLLGQCHHCGPGWRTPLSTAPA